MRRVLSGFLAVALAETAMISRPLLGQETPEQVVANAFSAISRRDWASFRDLVHPVALQTSRQEQLGMLILVAEQRRAGEDVGGGYNPQEVAIAEHLTIVGSTTARYFGNATITELAALTVEEFFTRWLDAAYGPGRPSAVEDIVDRERQIIGSLQRADIAWVLYRRDIRSQHGEVLHVSLPGAVEILPLQLYSSHWRILLNIDLAHGPDVTGIFDVYEQRPIHPPTRREISRMDVKSGSPLHNSAVPDPLSIADSAFRAFDQGNWSRLAELVDRRRLGDFHREAIQNLVGELGMRRMRASGQEMPMVLIQEIGDSDTQRAASEHVDIMPGRPTIRELQNLTPEAFFIRWCATAYGTSGSRQPPNRTLWGVVYEGENRAHVLYESSQRTFDLPGSVMRMPLIFSDGHWRIELNNEIGDRLDMAMRLSLGR